MVLDSKHLNNLFINTDDNIHGVMYGYKIVNGLITNELCIQYNVLKKKELSELSANQVIPKHIEIEGVIYKTDVIEVDLPIPVCSISGDPTENQIFRRPVLGGCQLAACGGYGTMGFVALDNYDNSLVGVTNLHVIGCAAPYQSQDLNYVGTYGNFGAQYWFNNPFSLNNYTWPFVYQNLSQSNRLLGFVKRSYMLSPNLCSGGTFSVDKCINYIDAALLTLPSSAITNSDSWKQIGLTGLTTPPTFASTAEIDSLLSSKNPMYSTGRTTGAKGEGSTQIYAFSFGAGYVGYPVPGNKKSSVSYFNDLISIVASGSSIPAGTICSDVVRPGDSGSMIYAFFDGMPKIIGLIFAAASSFMNENWALGLVCRIDRISSLLNISPWTGDSRNCIDNPTTLVHQVPYLDTPRTISLSGNTYWQAGTYNIPVNKNMGTYYKFIPNL